MVYSSTIAVKTNLQINLSSKIGQTQLHAMNKISLNPDGLSISPLIVGVMRWGSWGAGLSSQGYRAIIDHCLELGLSTFDHADIYGDYTTEEEFGAVLKDAPELRNQMQLISKCGIRKVSTNRPSYKVKSYDTSRAHILQSVNQSLKNLNTDYLDLLLIHRPDPLMQVEEVAEAFRDLQTSGKVLHFGVSNFTPAQFNLLHQHFPLVTNQVEASLFHSQPLWDGTFDDLQSHQLRPTVWSPLGGGQLFTEKPDDKINALRELLQEMGERYGGSAPDQMLLAWLLKHPSGPVPVLGTSRADRISTAMDSLTINLSREDWFHLLEVARGERVP